MSKLSKNQSISNLIWLWQKSNQESGNTLIIAMSLGLLLIAATTAAIVSSTRNKTNVTATEASVQAVEVAELGVTRSHNFLAQNPEFALAPKPANPKWDASNAPILATTIPEGSYANTSGTKSTCGQVLALPTNQTAITEASSNSEFIFAQNVDNSDANKGSFEVLNYVLRKPNGQDSATTAEIIANNDSFGVGQVIGFGELTLRSNVPDPNSRSQVKVTIPLVKRQPDQIPFPGVWLSGQNTASAPSSLKADLMVTTCDNVNLNIEPGYDVIISSVTFPKLPAIPSGIPDLGTITNEIHLPRVNSSGVVTDTPDSNGIYHYVVDGINLSANQDLNIIPGYKVNLYLRGRIEPLPNSSVVIHECSNMTVNGKLYTCDSANPQNATSDGRTGYTNFNFKIFGYGHSGTPHATVNPSDANFGTNYSSTSPNNFPYVCLRGNGETMAFIFAPDYSVGVAGTGSNDGFQGALWVKKWVDAGTVSGCTSNTSQVAAVQTINAWSDVGLVPQNIPPLIDNISKWEREAVN
ncbi:MAG: hypothetical protein IGQ45_05480 [Cyanobacterium sp. T60_A2020_053]|nr:hypothetical protein [Cyanobacterium sp. T60_A2020_053]